MFFSDKILFMFIHLCFSSPILAHSRFFLYWYFKEDFNRICFLALWIHFTQESLILLLSTDDSILNSFTFVTTEPSEPIDFYQISKNVSSKTNRYFFAKGYFWYAWEAYEFALEKWLSQSFIHSIFLFSWFLEPGRLYQLQEKTCRLILVRRYSII